MINYYQTTGWQSKRNYSWIRYIWLVLRNFRVKCIQELNRRFRKVPVRQSIATRIQLAPLHTRYRFFRCSTKSKRLKWSSFSTSNLLRYYIHFDRIQLRHLVTYFLNTFHGTRRCAKTNKIFSLERPHYSMKIIFHIYIL